MELDRERTEAKRMAAMILRELADQLANVSVELHHRAHMLAIAAEEEQQDVPPV